MSNNIPLNDLTVSSTAGRPRDGEDSRGSLLSLPALDDLMGETRVIRMPLVDAVALGPEAWEGVWTGGAASSPFASWSWYRAWVDVAAPENVRAAEALVVRERGDEVAAILPVVVQPQWAGPLRADTLTWGSGDVGAPDHLDVPARADADLGGLAAALADMLWDAIVLPNVADAAAGVARLADAFRERGYAVRRRPLWGCPYLDLPASWDEYLATLSSSRRQTFRRKERKLHRDHDVRLVEHGVENLDEGWERLMRLHRLRWDAGGSAFAGGMGPVVHRRFARELARAGRLWLFVLELDGEAAAAWYGFGDGRTVYFFQSGRDPRWDRTSAGLVLMNMMIRRAIEGGYQRFDFLRGEEAYKMQWTSTQRVCYEWAIFRPGARGWGLRAAFASRRLRAEWRERKRRGDEDRD